MEGKEIWRVLKWKELYHISEIILAFFAPLVFSEAEEWRYKTEQE